MDTAITTATHDDILDFADTVVNTPSKAARRDRAMEAAHTAGLPACEICGRGIKAGGFVVAGCVVGPTCAAKLRKAGLLG